MTKSRIFLIRGYPAFLKNCFPFFTGYVHVLRIHATLLYEKKVGMTDLLHEKALTIKGIPRLHRTLLTKCLCAAPEHAADNMIIQKTFRPQSHPNLFCLSYSNKIQLNMQEISEHFALHIPTAKSHFLHILHRINKPFSVFFVFMCTYSCHIQHFFFVFRLQDAHVYEGLVGKYHIGRNFFLSGNLQAEGTKFLEKRLVLLTKFSCTCV